MPEGRIAKPQLRDLHAAYAKRSLVIVAVVGVVSAFAYKTLIADVYERKAEEFYKHYDPEKALESMNAAGLMQSSPK